MNLTSDFDPAFDPLISIISSTNDFDCLQHFILHYRSTSLNLAFSSAIQPVKINNMKSHTRSHREAAQARDEARRQEYARYAPLSAEIAAIYDSRRLTEEDIDHMAELDTESRTFNRQSVNYHE